MADSHIDDSPFGDNDRIQTVDPKFWDSVLVFCLTNSTLKSSMKLPTLDEFDDSL